MSVVLQIRDVVEDIRHRFRSVVHLRTGRVMALEVRACPAAGELDHLRPVTGIAERLVRLDVRFAAEAARRGAEYERLLPLHLTLWADTVCAEYNPLVPLLDTLSDIGRDPGQVVIRLVVPPGEATPANLPVGLARLRAAGFGLGLDAVGTFPMATLIDVAPEVLLLGTRHTTGLPATPPALAALAGSAALATQTGATLVADGCDTTEQAIALRAHGVSLVQGDLLGPTRRRPHTQPVPAALLDQLIPPTAVPPGTRNGHHAQPVRTAPAPTRPAVVADLAHPAAMIPHDTTGEAARELFADRPELTGLVLVDDHQRPVLSLNRDRFMLAITGPFGHSLYARRRAADLGDLPRTLGMGASLAEAIDMVADTNAQRMYDDIVVVDGPGRCHGVLRIGDLVRDMAQRQSAPPRRPQPSPRAS